MGLGVAFMLRGSELVLYSRSRHHLLARDLTFLSGDGGGAPCGVRICIKSSKMNPGPVLRSYNANGTAFCVVAWLWRHWCSLGAKPDPGARIFAGFTRSTLAKAIQRVVRVHHIGDSGYVFHSLAATGRSQHPPKLGKGPPKVYSRFRPLEIRHLVADLRLDV